ncbi:hypothetical protein YWS52_33250 [Chitiniphilus shinanonensis]
MGGQELIQRRVVAAVAEEFDEACGIHVLSCCWCRRAMPAEVAVDAALAPGKGRIIASIAANCMGGGAGAGICVGNGDNAGPRRSGVR